MPEESVRFNQIAKPGVAERKGDEVIPGWQDDGTVDWEPDPFREMIGAAGKQDFVNASAALAQETADREAALFHVNGIVGQINVAVGDLDAQVGEIDGTVTDVVGRVGNLEIGQSAGTLVYATVVALNADLGHPDKAKAEVYADPGGDDVNGVYQKSGAPGTGDWIRISPLAVTSLSNRLTASQADIAGLQAIVTRTDGQPVELRLVDNGGFVIGRWNAAAVQAAGVKVGPVAMLRDRGADTGDGLWVADALGFRLFRATAAGLGARRVDIGVVSGIQESVASTPGLLMKDRSGFLAFRASADGVRTNRIDLGGGVMQTAANAKGLRLRDGLGFIYFAADDAGMTADSVQVGDAGRLQSSSGEGLTIKDKSGFVVMRVTSAGLTFLGSGNDTSPGPVSGEIGAVEVFIDNGVKAWVDGHGVIALTPGDDGTYRTVRLAQDGAAQAVTWLVDRGGVTERGVDWTDFNSSLASSVSVIALALAAQQSNSAGVANDGVVTNACPIPGRIAMWSGGVRVLDTSQDGGSLGLKVVPANLRHLVDAVEVREGNSGETGWVRYGQRLVENDGTGVAALVGTVGISGQPYNGWKKGSPIYANLMQCVRRARYMAARLNATLDARYFPWCGGESDKAKTRAAYLAELQTYRGDIDTDVKAILPPGAPDVVLVMWQFSSWQRGTGGIATSGAAQSMVQAEIDDPVHFVCTGPAYPYPYDDPEDDGIHLTPLGQALQKEVMALARNLHKAGQWPGALRLLSAVRTGGTIVAKVSGIFDGLVLDTTNVTDPGNYGLEFSQTGGTPVTITGATITGTDEITVTLSGDPGATSTETLGAGLTGIVNTPSGPTTGPRTCFRDSRTWASVIAGQTLRHWMVAYPVTVTH